MGAYVVKPHPDRDEYVIWSTITENPYFVGDRAATLDFLHRDADGAYLIATDRPEDRIDRADLRGSSALWPSEHSPYLGWGKTTIYMQRGILKTADMGECARRLTMADGDPGVCYELDPDMSDLLEPLE